MNSKTLGKLAVPMAAIDRVGTVASVEPEDEGAEESNSAKGTTAPPANSDALSVNPAAPSDDPFVRESAPTKTTDDSSEEESASEENASASPAKQVFAVWSLSGESKAVAHFRDETVGVLATTGEIAVRTADILLIKRQNESQGKVSFSIELRDGSKVSGRFASPALNLTFYGQAWHVPTRHVIEFNQPAGALSGPENVTVTNNEVGSDTSKDE